MPNYTILGVSHSPLFLEMPKYGPFMAKTWSSHGPSKIFPLIIINVPRGVQCQISQLWVYPKVPFP